MSRVSAPVRRAPAGPGRVKAAHPSICERLARRASQDAQRAVEKATKNRRRAVPQHPAGAAIAARGRGRATGVEAAEEEPEPGSSSSAGSADRAASFVASIERLSKIGLSAAQFNKAYDKLLKA